MAVKTFTTGEVLTASDTNTYLANSGLVYVTSTTFTNAPTVQLDNCFTSTYDHYRVLFQANSTLTTAQYCWWRLATAGNPGTPITANYFSKGVWWNLATASATQVDHDARTDRMCLGPLGEPNYPPIAAAFDVFDPAVAKPTSFNGMTTGLYSSVYYDFTINGGSHTASTAYAGIYFFPSGGNMTGKVSIYGYRKA